MTKARKKSKNKRSTSGSNPNPMPPVLKPVAAAAPAKIQTSSYNAIEYVKKDLKWSLLTTVIVVVILVVLYIVLG